MGCCPALLNLTLCLVLNLAIFYLELQSSFRGRCRRKIRLCQKLLPLQTYPRITTHDFAQILPVMCLLSEGQSGEPVLPRFRRALARLDDVTPPHRFKRPKDYYRVKYYEACDKIKTESESRFNQAKLKPVSNLEKLLVGVANSDDFSEHLEELERSCFGTDINCGRLGHQLHLVQDAVKTTLPEVRQVTNIRTICETVNKTPVIKTLVGEVHKLLRLYKTLPVASATSERTVSSLRRLKNYLRSTMNQNRLNNSLLLHCHKFIMHTLDTVDTAKKFVMQTNNAKAILENTRLGVCA